MSTYKSRYGEHDIREGFRVVGIDTLKRIRDCQASGIKLLEVAERANVKYWTFTGIIARLEQRDATSVKDQIYNQIDQALTAFGF